MDPYCVIHSESNLELVGGYRKNNEIINDVEESYPLRQVLITPFEQSVDFDVSGYVRRTLDPGVYHQIGGRPFKQDAKAISCCICNDDMQFLGILDYDDLNIPLYEDNHIPVALIIGDYDCMNLYACNECSVLGLVWAR